MAASKSKKKNTSQKTSAPSKPLSTQKKIIFFGITFSIPILFFLILEISLRSINYLGDTKLFTDPNIPDKEYLIPNPNFAARYFFYTKTIPNPSIDVFLKEKPENGFRVFALGGSSAAAYPYGFNGTFSRVVKDALDEAMPNKHVEVVNLGISAINSYTLFDQVDEILEHKPDAIMIYAGHNEFYGALGVGSNENLGGFPAFVRFYLKLQRFKTFMFLRQTIVDFGKWFSTSVMGNEIDESATLMERIISSRSIELNSPIYDLAMIQWESNLKTIITAFNEQGIPVFVGSVASNEKDHFPFVSIESEELPTAAEVFEEAKSEYEAEEYDLALNNFDYARDLDGLKFRAPSAINDIISKVAEEEELTHYVPYQERLRTESENGIIGFNFMLEHLHPNQEGYYLLGEEFGKKMIQVLNSGSVNWSNKLDQMMLTEYDHRIAWHRVETLKQSFPFVQDGSKKYYQDTYKPLSKADSLAFLSVHAKLSWDKGKVELAEYYQSVGDDESAIREYLGLIRNQPWNESPYIFSSRIYLQKNDFDSARPLLEAAYEINPNEAFTTKMLGAITLDAGNTKRAIELLEESRALNPNDPQMLFNLSGAYGVDRNFIKAIEIANQVREINPNFPGLNGWIAQLNQAINQQQRGN